QVAADAVLILWHAASEAAHGQLAALRAEARDQAHEADAGRDQATAELDATRAQLAELRATLAAEREAHAAPGARLQETCRHRDEAGHHLVQVKAGCTVELERARERVTAAEERAVSHEQRALRDIDRERTARQHSEQQRDALRVQLQTSRAERQERAVHHADAHRTQPRQAANRQRRAA
ncbi:hypothetical protein DFQ30_005518, partial [Apophysomyces sp. BC1015]